VSSEQVNLAARHQTGFVDGRRFLPDRPDRGAGQEKGVSAWARGATTQQTRTQASADPACRPEKSASWELVGVRHGVAQKLKGN
jgi:hypothetical protein